MITTALTETSNLSSTTKTNPFHIPNRRHSRSTLRKLESAWREKYVFNVNQIIIVNVDDK